MFQTAHLTHSYDVIVLESITDVRFLQHTVTENKGPPTKCHRA